MSRSGTNERSPSPCRWRPERYRATLVLLARMHWDPRLAGKLDPSDIAQEALLASHAALGEFRGATEAEFVHWLRRILSSKLHDALRTFTADKRDVRLERSFDQLLARSSARLEALLARRTAEVPEKLEMAERINALAQALEELPADQRLAVALKHLRGLSLQEVGQTMERSPEAVAGLLRRGLVKLRRFLGNDAHDAP